MLALGGSRGSRAKKPAGYKTDDIPRDVLGNVKDVAPLDIQARVSRMRKPEASAFARDATAALLIAVVRTALEDRTLHDELSGYGAYADRVRYRLIPWVY